MKYKRSNGADGAKSKCDRKISIDHYYIDRTFNCAVTLQEYMKSRFSMEISNQPWVHKHISRFSCKQMVLWYQKSNYELNSGLSLIDIILKCASLTYWILCYDANNPFIRQCFTANKVRCNIRISSPSWDFQSANTLIHFRYSSRMWIQLPVTQVYQKRLFPSTFSATRRI